MSAPEEPPRSETSDDESPPESGRGRRRRVLPLSVLPTLFTLANLVCGVLALSYLMDVATLFGGARAQLASDRVVLAGWLILVAMVFDALDGRVARITRTTSEFGAQLDSLADLVTFGVTPALTGKVLIQGVLDIEAFGKLAFLAAAFFAVCAALRLARYNSEHEETTAAVTTFAGLATPGAAGVVAAVAICHPRILSWWEGAGLGESTAAHLIAIGLLMGLGVLMVSRVPYPHFANKLLKTGNSAGRIGLLLGALVLGIHFLEEWVLIVGFGAYAFWAPLSYVPRHLWRRGRDPRAVTELFD